MSNQSNQFEFISMEHLSVWAMDVHKVMALLEIADQDPSKANVYKALSGGYQLLERYGSKVPPMVTEEINRQERIALEKVSHEREPDQTPPRGRIIVCSCLGFDVGVVKRKLEDML